MKRGCKTIQSVKQALVIPEISAQPRKGNSGVAGACYIPLTQDKCAIVDFEDYPRLSKYKWYL